MALRSACRRFKNLYRLQGLHRTFERWSDILRWCTEAPQTVNKGIKRVMIHITPDNGPFEPQPTDRGNHEHLKQADFSLLLVWSTFTNFLSRFTALEELVIKGSPFCHHKRNIQTLFRLSLPTYDFLPKLTSLSFEIHCIPCALNLPVHLTPAAPRLQHLKLTDLAYDLPTLKHIHSMWCKRNEQSTFPLRGLTVKVDLEGRASKVVQKVDRMFPNLSHLEMIRFDGNNPSGRESIAVVPVFFLVARPEETELKEDGREGRWVYRLWDNRDDRISYHQRHGEDTTPDSWKEDSSWDDLLIAFSHLDNLEAFDLVIDLSIIEPRTHSAMKRSEYHHRYLEAQRSFEHYHVPNLQLVSAMQCAAEQIVSHCPTLKRGHFWQSPRPRGSTSRLDYKDVPLWRRWTWYRLRQEDDNLRKRRGTIIIRIDPIVEEFSAEWMANMDCTEEP